MTAATVAVSPSGPSARQANTDMLSFKYALQHYGGDGKPLPDWLVRFPR